MPTVNVRFMGNLREAAGVESKTTTTKEGSCLKDLFDQLVDEAVGEFKARLGAVLRGRGGLIVLINGVESGSCGGQGSELRDGDEITLIPVSHGG
ncbi:MAG: MoaD/ThiS family protein [Candidatus Bathyarchaeia archaeon]